LNLITASEESLPPFVLGGFQHWNKALQKFNDHEGGTFHSQALMALRVYDSRQGIDIRFNAQLMHQQQEARNALRAIVTTVLHLAQQGVALRGHDESSGNFDALLELRASDDASLKNWLDNHRITWTSHEIQNEILKTASHEVQRLLASQMKRAGFFGIMVDETTDAASLEEVSICLRTTTEDLEPVEHFIGFVQTNSTTGAALADLIVDTITRLNLDIHLCRSQTYDGASNMRGAIKGVQARMLEVLLHLLRQPPP